MAINKAPIPVAITAPRREIIPTFAALIPPDNFLNPVTAPPVILSSCVSPNLLIWLKSCCSLAAPSIDLAKLSTPF